MEAEFEFDVGNQVLAYSNGLLYRAKCLKRRKTETGDIQYFISYKGFKSKWNEWVDDDELLEVNEINCGHKERLDTNFKMLKRSKKKKKEPNSSFPKDEGLKKRGRPRKSIHTEPAVQAIEETAGLSIENEAAVIINIIPSIDLLVNRLNDINLPYKLRKTLIFDYMMNNKYHMCFKFPEDNCLAEVIHAFTQSSYFVDDSQKKLSTMLCETLMQYFNDNVHKLLLLDNEKRYKLHKQSKRYFHQRLKDRPNITYMFKNNLKTKKQVSCYVYGPIYLLRLLVNLPTILVKNSKLPDCDLDTFAHCIQRLYQFLEKNHKMYFSVDDYMPTNLIKCT